MKNNSVRDELILSIIFLILSSAVFVFVYMRSVKNHDLSIKFFSEWKREFQKKDEISSLNRSIFLLEEKKNLLETHFAKSSDVVPFLDYLENLAKKVGIGAGVSLVDMPENEDGLIVEMKVNGDFKNVYKFLKLLENSPYDQELESVDLLNVVKKEDPSTKSVKTEWEALLRIKLLSFIK